MLQCWGCLLMPAKSKSRQTCRLELLGYGLRCQRWRARVNCRKEGPSSAQVPEPVRLWRSAAQRAATRAFLLGLRPPPALGTAPRVLGRGELLPKGARHERKPPRQQWRKGRRLVHATLVAILRLAVPRLPQYRTYRRGSELKRWSDTANGLTLTFVVFSVW